METEGACKAKLNSSFASPSCFLDDFNETTCQVVMWTAYGASLFTTGLIMKQEEAFNSWHFPQFILRGSAVKEYQDIPLIICLPTFGFFCFLMVFSSFSSLDETLCSSEFLRPRSWCVKGEKEIEDPFFVSSTNAQIL